MTTLNINNLANAQAIGWSDAAITRNAAGRVGMPAITLTQGTITADAPILNATSTWNNAGVTFAGIRANITDTASNAASLLMDLQVGGASRFAVGKSGAVRGIGATTNYGIRLQNGVDALYLSADNQYRSSIVSAWGLSIYTGSNGVGINGPQVAAGGEAIIEPNGVNLYKSGIIFGRHAGQTVNNPPNNVFKNCFIKFDPHVNNDETQDLEITGQAASTTATTMLVGGNVAITGGDGSSTSAGAAHGGDVVLAGGTGYGTGRNGVVIISTLPTSASGLPTGAIWNDGGTLKVA